MKISVRNPCDGELQRIFTREESRGASRFYVRVRVNATTGRFGLCICSQESFCLHRYCLENVALGRLRRREEREV